jgi:methylmalonyl-CoA mutase
MTTTGPTPADAGKAHDAALAQWRRQVAKVLERGGLAGSAGTPEPERALDTTTYDDIVVRALYTRSDAAAEPPLPGTAPFTRGSVPAGARTGWDVRARHVLGPDPAATNQSVRTDLANGVTSLWLVLPEHGVTREHLARVLEGVPLDQTPVVLQAGHAIEATAADFFAIATEQADAGEVDLAAVSVCLGADPLSCPATGAEPPDPGALAAAVRLARSALRWGGQATTFLADGTTVHEAGGSDAEELGTTLAAATAYLRAQVQAGVELSAAYDQIEFRHCVTDDQFQGIAKLRAARRMWARVGEVTGARPTAGVRQHAVTSTAMLSRRDPWVNLLRTTIAAFAAATGGATSVTVRPFDSSATGQWPGIAPDFAARIARNCQLVLLEESHIGRVADPGGGSWYLESLTDAVAAAAWDWFQRIESAGGFGAASDLIRTRVGATAARRRADVAHRRLALTGINEFPDLSAPDAAVPALDPDAGYGADFERLRDRSDAHRAEHGARPTAVLCLLGERAAGPATYAANLLATGGIDTVRFGPYAGAADVPASELSAHSPLVVLCGADKVDTADLAATVAALRRSGVARVAVTGAWTGSSAGAPDVLTSDIDAVGVLSGLLDSLGVR